MQPDPRNCPTVGAGSDSESCAPFEPVGELPDAMKKRDDGPNTRKQLVVNPMRRQRALGNPTIDSLLGKVEQASNVSNSQVHGRSYLTCRRKRIIAIRPSA
jgi:hypothetical protein